MAVAIGIVIFAVTCAFVVPFLAIYANWGWHDARILCEICFALFWIFLCYVAYTNDTKQLIRSHAYIDYRSRKLVKLDGLHKIQAFEFHEKQLALQEIEKVKNLNSKISSYAYDSMEKKHDWAVAGGIAEAIAGPVAGVATAMHTIEKNKQIDHDNYNSASWKLSSALTEINYNTIANMKKKLPIVHSIEELKEVVTIDTSWNPKTLYSFLEITEPVIKTDKQTGAVLVQAKWEQKDGPHYIDGYIRGKLYTDSGEYAGSVCFTLPKSGASEKEGEFSGICAFPKASPTYTIQFEPIDLWEIIDKKQKRTTNEDKLTPEEHQALVAESQKPYEDEMHIRIW